MRKNWIALSLHTEFMAVFVSVNHNLQHLSSDNYSPLARNATILLKIRGGRFIFQSNMFVQSICTAWLGSSSTIEFERHHS